MSPLGKFTLALVGLRCFGASGFFIGMILGHILIDKTILIKALEKRLSLIDDNIRLLLPYKFYRYYNRIDGNFWGKMWGAILGSVLFGLNGFIFFFIVGHFVFDTPNSRHARKFRRRFDELFDNNLFKICGAVLGYMLKSRILLFVGVIIGFFIDYYRVENASLFTFQRIKNFWVRFNPLHLWRHSKEARHTSFLQSIAGLAAKVAKADGAVSENEIRVFKKIFEIRQEENSKIGKVFNQAKTSTEGFEVYAKQLNWLTNNNLDLKETVLENLFKIAAADGNITSEEQELLHQISEIIEFPEGNFEILSKMFEPKVECTVLQDFYEVLGVFCNASDCEIKRRWKELINEYHPDRLQSQGASKQEIEETTVKMAEINNAYQSIMKNRNAV